MITATYLSSGPTSAPTFTVALDARGHVTVTRHAPSQPQHGAATHHGVLPPDALARIRERLLTPQPARRPVTEVGIASAPAAAILATSPPLPTAPPLLVHFNATPASLEALDHASWQVPRAGDLVTVLARVAAATLAGTLGSVDTGLPAAIEREGVLLRFRIEGERHQPTALVYESGRCEAWEDVNDWTGRLVGEGQADVVTVRAAHAAVVALVDAVRASKRPMPEMGEAHDPTQSLSVGFARAGRLDGWSTVWGRASRNDAPLEPVPDDVPIPLFDAAAVQLRALRDGPCVARRPDRAPVPARHAEQPPQLTAEEWEALYAPLPAPTPAPPPATDPRVPWLAWLRSQLDHGAAHSAMLSAAEHPPPQVHVYGCVNGDDVQMSFAPPVDLRAFVTAMGIASPLALASDEDGQAFRLVTASEGRHEHPFAAPRVGPWTVDAGTSSFHAGRVVQRWAGFWLYDAHSVPDATVSSVVLTDTRIRGGA